MLHVTFAKARSTIWDQIFHTAVFLTEDTVKIDTGNSMIRKRT
jgi:hypothetical protein